MRRHPFATALGAALAMLPVAQAALRIDYQLENVAAEKQWRITVAVEGLEAAAGHVKLVFDDWGGWSAEKALHPRVLSAEPALTVDGPTQLSVSEPMLGRLRVVLAIPVNEWGSDLQRRCSLAPWRTDAYTCGFAINTLPSLIVDDQPVTAERRITVTTAPGQTLVTGWGGAALHTQTVTLDHDIDNALIFFGTPAFTAHAVEGDASFEVFQFGAGRSIVESVLELVRKLVPAYGASTGRKRDGPLRVFVEDRGGGGVRVDHGLAVSWTPSDDPSERSPYFKILVAHELFHDWLGGYVQPPNETMVWFHEGFTDYLALWHLAQTELVPRTWFAERLAEIDAEARASSAFRHVAFAGNTEWRDGDGPRETLAYKGGAMLAFFLDVALRDRGLGGVPELLGDLIRTQTLSVAALASWLEAHGMRDFYAAYIAKADLPELHEALASIGFTIEESPAMLSYLGIRASSEPFGTITALDPEGPAARAGAKVGDVITGLWPTRGSQPEITDEVSTTYRYGLTRFEPDAKSCFLSVRRGKEESKVELAPRAIPGGRRTGWRVDSDLADEFFAR
jgi:hypothetical protein